MQIVSAPTQYLASPLGSSDTSMVLQSFVDAKSNPITLTQTGLQFALVIKQAAQIEIILCNAITQNSDGTCTIGFATNGRNLDPTTPYAGYSTGLSFDAGSDVMLTNDPWTMSQFANLGEKTTFSIVPASSAAPVSANDLTTLAYVQALVLGTLTTINVVVPGNAGATIAAGNLVYFNEGAGEWELANAGASSTCADVLLGIAQGAGTTSSAIAGGVLLQGVDSNQTGLTSGSMYYAANSAGTIATSPGTVNIAIGAAKDSTQLYFAPNFNVQLTANQLAALAGTSGTTPSSSNKFVDNADTGTSGNGKVLRLNGSGALPAVDGSNLTGSPAFNGANFTGLLTNFSAGLTASLSTTTNANNDVVVTTGFQPRLIKLYYSIQGENNNYPSTPAPVTLSGTVFYEGTTLLYNLTDPTNPISSAIPSAGQSSGTGGNSNIEITLSIAAVSGTGFTIRRQTTGGNGPTATAIISYEAYA